MTSEQIKNLCLMVAENGKRLPDGSHEAIPLMHVQMLGEIALQLSIANEREAVRDNPDLRLCECGHAIGQHKWSNGKFFCYGPGGPRGCECLKGSL